MNAGPRPWGTAKPGRGSTTSGLQDTCFFGFAALSSGERSADGSGGVRHPVGNRDMTPKFLGGIAPDTAGKDRREVLAKWLASDENPFFAKNLANIVWGHFMGGGIVEPGDDVRISNPPSNPELLDELGKRFSKSGDDFKLENLILTLRPRSTF